jgi:hypothetical protein
LCPTVHQHRPGGAAATCRGGLSTRHAPTAAAAAHPDHRQRGVGRGRIVAGKPVLTGGAAGRAARVVATAAAGPPREAGGRSTGQSRDAQLRSIGVVVVAAVGVTSGPCAGVGRACRGSVGSRRAAAVGYVVPLSAGQRDDEGDAGRVEDQVVLGAGTTAVDRRRPGVAPPPLQLLLRRRRRAGRAAPHRGDDAPSICSRWTKNSKRGRS